MASVSGCPCFTISSSCCCPGQHFSSTAAYSVPQPALSCSNAVSSSCSFAWASPFSNTPNQIWRRSSPNHHRALITCMAEPFLIAKLESAERTYRELSTRLADPDVAGNPSEYQKIAKSVAELQEVVTTYENFKDVQAQLQESRELKDSGDRELAELAAEESVLHQGKLQELEEQLKGLGEQVAKGVNLFEHAKLILKSGPTVFE
ncbi:hypothetical protein L7F22_055512 [Adiantum nelumboides]|nr:hypothetical protein [Adiantum nelumboides]